MSPFLPRLNVRDLLNPPPEKADSSQPSSGLGASVAGQGNHTFPHSQAATQPGSRRPSYGAQSCGGKSDITNAAGHWVEGSVSVATEFPPGMSLNFYNAPVDSLAASRAAPPMQSQPMTTLPAGNANAHASQNQTGVPNDPETPRRGLRSRAHSRAPSRGESRAEEKRRRRPREVQPLAAGSGNMQKSSSLSHLQSAFAVNIVRDQPIYAQTGSGGGGGGSSTSSIVAGQYYRTQVQQGYYDSRGHFVAKGSIQNSQSLPNRDSVQHSGRQSLTDLTVGQAGGATSSKSRPAAAHQRSQSQQPDSGHQRIHRSGRGLKRETSIETVDKYNSLGSSAQSRSHSASNLELKSTLNWPFTNYGKFWQS